jgi:hypothetical protein
MTQGHILVRPGINKLEITAAGLAAYTGVTGGRCIANLTWEGLFERLPTETLN